MSKKSRLWEQYLSDLAVGIANIHTILDCAVVLGVPLSLYWGKHMDALKRHVDDVDSVGASFRYFRLCRYHDKSNGIGAALKFVGAFISNILMASRHPLQRECLFVILAKNRHFVFTSCANIKCFSKSA